MGQQKAIHHERSHTAVREARAINEVHVVLVGALDGQLDAVCHLVSVLLLRRQSDRRRRYIRSYSILLVFVVYSQPPQLRANSDRDTRKVGEVREAAFSTTPAGQPSSQRDAKGNSNIISPFLRPLCNKKSVSR